jgi:hypothetical protein
MCLALASYSCNKEKSKLPDGTDKVTEFATIPTIKSIYLSIKKAGLPRMSGFSQSQVVPAIQDTLYQSFAWGVLTADSQLAVYARDSVWLKGSLDKLVTLSKALGMQDIAKTLDERVRPLVDKKDWQLLESTFNNMQYTAEQAQLENKHYGNYTMMALGGWTETSRQFTGAIAANYSPEKAAILNTDAWLFLAGNLDLFPPTTGTYQSPVDGTKVPVGTLRDIMAAAGKAAPTELQLMNMEKSLDDIRAIYLQPS